LSSSDLFVVTAPSGAGKTTLIRRLLADLPDIYFSVSYTTRAMRAGEKEGVDYHFVQRAEFDRMAQAGEFLEWAEVHGCRYGTSARLVDGSLSRGRDVLLDVDTQGASSVRKLRAGAVLIFILPPDFATLKRRLEGRRLESPEEVERRIANARAEVEKYGGFDYVVINDSLEEALHRLEAILLAHRSRTARQKEVCARIVPLSATGDRNGRQTEE
jgi:guanylate kinase